MLYDKNFLTSMTFWGALLLALETFLLHIADLNPWINGIGIGLGAFLTIMGIRRKLGE